MSEPEGSNQNSLPWLFDPVAPIGEVQANRELFAMLAMSESPERQRTMYQTLRTSEEHYRQLVRDYCNLLAEYNNVHGMYDNIRDHNTHLNRELEEVTDDRDSILTDLDNLQSRITELETDNKRLQSLRMYDRVMLELIERQNH